MSLWADDEGEGGLAGSWGLALKGKVYHRACGQGNTRFGVKFINVGKVSFSEFESPAMEKGRGGQEGGGVPVGKGERSIIRHSGGNINPAKRSG